MIRCKDLSLKLVVWLIIYKNNSQSVHLGTIRFACICFQFLESVPCYLFGPSLFSYTTFFVFLCGFRLTAEEKSKVWKSYLLHVTKCKQPNRASHINKGKRTYTIFSHNLFTIFNLLSFLRRRRAWRPRGYWLLFY